jgi:DNA (cytosine-5)-methyltransferase 1
MRKVRSTDTAPEVTFRKALWAAGLRYRKNASKLPGKPDVVISSARLVVFIDGDFWHGGQWHRRNLRSLSEQFEHAESRNYWLTKISRNMARDCRATSQLLQDGWVVLRFWESQIKRDLEACVHMTLDATRCGPQPIPLAFVPDKTFAEFFAGIGLMRMGLERHGWSVKFANDLDSQKREMYCAQFGNSPCHLSGEDIHLLPADEVPDVTLATASFPCNDISLAGSRHGFFGKESSAFWGFTRVLREMAGRRPPLILLENVPGFLTSNNGTDFEQALLDLNDLGYSVDAFMLDAAWFVPQSRQRLFVVGVLGNSVDLGIGNLFDLRLDVDKVRPRALVQFICAHPRIRWSIRPLPPAPTRKSCLIDILEDIHHDSSEWWNETRASYLLSQMSERHRRVADRMIHGSEYTYGTVFRRVRNGRSMAELRTDGIAGCLRTPRGGSGRQILFKAGKGQFHVRLLSPRECARLMGADDFCLSVPLNQALFGFGDAVCVRAVEWIAQYYLNPLVNELIRTRPLVRVAQEGQLMSAQENALKAFDTWFRTLKAEKANHGFPAKGTMAGAVVVLDRLQHDFTLNIKHHLTPGGGQVAGVSGASVTKILQAYGETRPLISEGRTNRGLILAITSMLDALRAAGLENLGEEERNQILDDLKRYMAERVKEFHGKERLKVVFDPSLSTWQSISDILEKAKADGKDGPVAQHLVGAKLQLRFPDLAVSNHSYSTADTQIGRHGDFLINDAAFHVTVRPMHAVIQKCVKNLVDGYRPFLLVPEKQAAAAKGNAEMMAAGRITVQSIESFVGQNIEEISRFSAEQLTREYLALIELYNRRVDEAELDKSMLLEVPSNLTRARDKRKGGGRTNGNSGH